MNMNLDERIIEIEMKQAFQDQTIEELNQVIIKQQKLIDGLELKLKQVHLKIDNTSKDQLSNNQHEIPPHY